MRSRLPWQLVPGAVLIASEVFSCGQSPPPAAAPAPATSSTMSNNVDVGTSVTAMPSATPAASPSAKAPAPEPADSARASGPDRSMNDIRAVVASNRDTFRACYDQSLKAHPGIQGAFVLRFVVNPDGTVKSADAEPTHSEIHAADLEACAAKALKALKFPPSRKGMESTVNYPFDFHPRGSSKSSGSP